MSIKQWFQCKWYKLKHSKFFLFIITAIIFTTLTFCWMTIKYEYKNFFDKKRIVILNTSHVVVAQATEAPQEKVEEFGETPHEEVSPTVQKIRQTFIGEENLAVAIAKCESSLDSQRIGDTHMSKYSYGLFQINRTWHDYSPEYLLDEDNNIRVAKEIRDKGGWNRWACYSQGFYKKYL